MAGQFLKGKKFHFEGLALSDDERQNVRWVIAAMASLPVLRLGLAAYGRFHDIFVVRGEEPVRERRVDENGVVTEYDDDISGEVSAWGPVELALGDIYESGMGYNVVIHEMAHKLDLSNGEYDGCPDLPNGQGAAWKEAYVSAWKDFQSLLERPPSRRKLPLDEYAAESPEEFFAVTMEEYFDRPLHLKRVYPEVYAALSRYLSLDPETL
jgi:Mlc titration factor MtfA (ptsG expression regulator)